MLRVTSDKGTRKTDRQVRFPGIVAAARAAGVTREHAFRVLTGKRQSRSLEHKLRQHGLIGLGQGGAR